jgi:hypothetical protein
MGNQTEKRHAQKPYARQASVSGKFVTTQPIGSAMSQEQPVLAESLVFKLGPELVGPVLQPNRPQTRSTTKKVGKKPRRVTRGEKNSDMDSAFEGSSFDKEQSFHLNIPKINADGLPITLQEREAICTAQLAQQAMLIKSAKNIKESEALKLLWATAWCVGRVCSSRIIDLQLFKRCFRLKANYMESQACTVSKQGLYEGYEESCKAFGFLVSMSEWVYSVEQMC